MTSEVIIIFALAEFLILFTNTPPGAYGAISKSLIENRLNNYESRLSLPNKKTIPVYQHTKQPGIVSIHATWQP
jgi:hypothetical protein